MQGNGEDGLGHADGQGRLKVRWFEGPQHGCCKHSSPRNLHLVGSRGLSGDLQGLPVVPYNEKHLDTLVPEAPHTRFLLKKSGSYNLLTKPQYSLRLPAPTLRVTVQ